MDSSRRIKTDDFAADVRAGLSAAPKHLSSKYFYDDEGSRLFQEIMKLPEYYLTRAEHEIFADQTEKIYEAFTRRGDSFDLIELGAGDGSKTAVLIEYFLDRKADFAYIPIDISAEAQKKLAENFQGRFPTLSIRAHVGDYFQTLESLKNLSARPKIILFLGSNIGNFSRAESVDFFQKLRQAMNPQDFLFVGFDLHKNPRTILDAYDDEQGVTAAFNLNLLTRVNRELGADFDTAKFTHYATYHPTERAARSFLVSCEPQTVRIESLDESFSFAAWEPIFMEISQKFTLETIAGLASDGGFRIAENFFDRRKYYADSLWKIV